MQVQEKEWAPEDAPLVPITSKHFKISTVEYDCTLEEFRKDKNLKSKTLNIFLEISRVDLDKSILGNPSICDVILMNKVSAE